MAGLVLTSFQPQQFCNFMIWLILSTPCASSTFQKSKALIRPHTEREAGKQRNIFIIFLCQSDLSSTHPEPSSTPIFFFLYQIINSTALDQKLKWHIKHKNHKNAFQISFCPLCFASHLVSGVWIEPHLSCTEIRLAAPCSKHHQGIFQQPFSQLAFGIHSSMTKSTKADFKVFNT